MFRLVPLVAAIFVAAGASAQTVSGADYHLTEGPRDDPALTEAILKADSALFDAIFSACDIEKVAPMLTDDVRFIHDKWGEIAHSKAELLGKFRDGCARQASGADFHSRRQIVPGSVEVHPLNGYGALEIGQHRFFAVIPGKPERLTEVGRFMILWRQVDGVWKMAETISYSHQLAPQ